MIEFLKSRIKIFFSVSPNLHVLLLLEPGNTRSGTLQTASCVCITTTVEPQSIKTSEFVLAWHMPEIKFGLGQRQYSKLVRFLLLLLNFSYEIYFFQMVHKMVQ